MNQKSLMMHYLDLMHIYMVVVFSFIKICCVGITQECEIQCMY